MGEQYTVTAPPPASFLRPSRRARDRPRLHAGTSGSLRVIPSLSWLHYKAPTPSSAFLSLLCFPTPPPQLRRVPLASSAQTSLGKTVLQLRLILLNPSQPLWLSRITENLRLRLFFLAAGDLDRSSGSPRPASSGEPLSLFVGSIASS